MNALFALVSISLFVVPTLYHLISDYRTRHARDFSLIPHKGRHLVAALFRLALIAGAFAVNMAHDLIALTWLPYLGVAFASALMILFSATDRRLFIDAETGLLSWQKISLPWWRPRTRIAYIDRIGRLSYDGGRYLHLFGLATLQQRWSVNYNGAVSTSGHYSEKTLHRLVATVNNYLAAFFRHDDGASRERRRLCCEQLEARLSPARKRKAARRAARKARAEARQQAEQQAAARRKARKQAKRRSDMDAKFAA